MKNLKYDKMIKIGNISKIAKKEMQITLQKNCNERKFY